MVTGCHGNRCSTLERKLGQVGEACERKKESFSVMIINYDDVLADVAEYMQWIERKEAELTGMPSGGSSVEQACSALIRHDVSLCASLCCPCGDTGDIF